MLKAQYPGQDKIQKEILQAELIQERKSVVQWRLLNEASAILNSQLNSGSLPLKFIKCAVKLVSAEEALLALKEGKGSGLKVFKYFPRISTEEELIEESVEKPLGAIELIFNKGTVIKRDASHFSSEELYGFSAIKKNLLGIPLKASGKIIGALLMANKDGNDSFTQDDEELLMILGSQLGIALENSRLYEKIDEKLQDKVDELEQVNEILLEKHTILEKSLEIHKQLTEVALRDQGIKAICSTLTAFLDSPVRVEDQNFEVIATTMEKATQTYLTGKDLIEKGIYAEQIKTLLEERRFVEIHIDENTTQYFVPIVGRKIVRGFITTAFINKTLKRLDQVALEQGATIIALEMLKHKAAVEQRRRLRENFVEQVLDREYESEEWVHHRTVELGFNLKNTYQIVIVDIQPGEKGKSRPELYHEIREFCEEFFLSSIVVNKNNRIFILVTLNSKKDGHETKDICNSLKDLLDQIIGSGTWWIALGTRFSKLSDCYLSYNKAVTTLDVMKALRLKNKIVANDNLGIFSLLEINLKRFAEFTKMTLGPLLEYDRKHNTQLVDTLNLYYKYNGNVLKAARNGFLNPSTMKYRLRRIQELTKLDLRNSEVNLQLQLAIRLINYDCSGWE
ncbi:MAG: helix-turn-helix domain-containing protein [Bacillota bacterium]|nr:helix-turn-helix domain-containing protein [Bacillota bacterium]